MTDWKWWLVGALGALVIEILPPATHFFFLCVTFGAIGGAFAAYFTEISWLPWVVCVGVTFGLRPFLVPLAKFLFAKQKPEQPE